jgi:hypothetical protein
VVGGHEDTDTTVLVGALLAELLHLATVIDFVVLENSHLHVLVLVGDALGCRVRLLLALLPTSTQAKDKVQGALLLDVVVRQRAAERRVGRKETVVSQPVVSSAPETMCCKERHQTTYPSSSCFPAKIRRC